MLQMPNRRHAEDFNNIVHARAMNISNSVKIPCHIIHGIGQLKNSPENGQQCPSKSSDAC